MAGEDDLEVGTNRSVSRSAIVGGLALLLAAGALAVAAVQGVSGGAGGAGGDSARVALDVAPARGRRLAQEGGGIPDEVWGKAVVHVCFTTDSADLRAVAVAMTSALRSTASPERLRFHLVVPAKMASAIQEVIGRYLPTMPLDVWSDEALEKRINVHTPQRKDSRVRRRLVSPFNFAPFYLREFLGSKHKAKRMIYLDTDTLVLGDLVALHDIDIQGHPVAAVKNCDVRWDDYIDFEVLEGFGSKDLDPRACVTERTIVMYDLELWAAGNYTGMIVEWLQRYRSAPDELWFEGMATPPWLLSVRDNVFDIGAEWNCRGLARDSMTLPESKALRSGGFDFAAFKTLGTTFSEFGRVQPFVATCSATAKLLHFDGAMRPWRTDRFNSLPPLCALPMPLIAEEWQWLRSIKVFCEESKYVMCAEVWSKFITEEVACQLKDFDAEWREDEEEWEERRHDAEEKHRQEQRLLQGALSKDKKRRPIEREREKKRLRYVQRWGGDAGPPMQQGKAH